MKLPLLSRFLALALLLAGVPSAVVAAPAGSAISYQGRLVDGGTPATGSYEFRFTLHDAVAAGAQVGPTRTNAPVAVADGTFGTAIDFGAGTFTGDARWLEIGVRTNGSPADFTPLTPRQALNAVPYALHALDGPQLTGNNTFTGNQTVNGLVAATAFAGNGGNLSGLDAAKLTGGTIAARTRTRVTLARGVGLALDPVTNA